MGALVRHRLPGEGAQSLIDRPVALAWHLAVIVALTWFPFGLHPLAGSERTAVPTNPWDVAANLVLFVPFAAAVVAVLKAGRSPIRHHPWIAAASTAAASTAIEVGQLFLESRVASPLDVLSNAAGALAAGFAAAGLLRSGVRPTRLIAATVVPVLVLAVTYVVGSAVYVSSALRLDGWESAYPVVAGDEAGADRRYVGVVEDARICAGSAPEEVCVGPGALIEARGRLVESAERSQSVRLSAVVRSTSDAQTGPTRIVSFSHGADERNATLGQEGQALVFRLRSPWTGPNGREPEFWMPGAVLAGLRTRVTASYAAGAVTIAAENERGSRVERLRFGLIESWFLVGFSEGDAARTTVVPAHAVRGVPIAALVLFAPLGMLAGRTTRRRHSGSAASALAAMGLLALMDGLLGTAPALVPTLLAGTSAALFACLSSVRDRSLPTADASPRRGDRPA